MDNIDYNDVGTGSELRGDYKRNYTAEQMAWLAKDLAFVDKDTPVFITSHAPVSAPSGVGWNNSYLNGADAPAAAPSLCIAAAFAAIHPTFRQKGKYR